MCIYVCYTCVVCSRLKDGPDLASNLICGGWSGLLLEGAPPFVLAREVWSTEGASLFTNVMVPYYGRIKP